MRMILHIMRKDLRRHWVELGLYLLVCFGWAWQQAHPGGWIWRHQQEVLPIALFGLWFLIVVRVVHGECLVGDREFWSTRPYQCPHLMIEKAAFLVLTLNAPLFIAQICLLRHADIPLSPALVPGLLFLQLMFVFFLTFPAAALASITQSLVQWLLTIGALLIAGLVISWLPWDKLPNTLAQQEEVGSWIAAAIIVPALLFVLLWQYARRRIWPARLAGVAACLAVPIAILLARVPLVRSIGYPQAKGENPLRVSFDDRDSGGKREYTRGMAFGQETSILIPVMFGSADPDMTVAVDGLRATLTGDNGWHWQSQWINTSIRMSTETYAGPITLYMPVDVVSQLENVHARMLVEYAFSTYRLGRKQRIDTSRDRFTVEGAGTCHWWGTASGGMSLNGLECVSPLRTATVMVSQIESRGYTCKDDSEPPIPEGRHTTSVDYGTELAPAEFDPNPVHTFAFTFGGWFPPVRSVNSPKDFRTASLCRGTLLLVRTGVLVDKMRATYDLGPIGTKSKSKKADPDAAESSVPFIPKAR